MVLCILVQIIILVDGLQLATACYCDYSEYECEIQDNFNFDSFDVLQKIRFSVVWIMLGLYAIPTIVVLPLFYYAMRRLKMIDPEFYKNSRVRVFLLAIFLFGFMAFHLYWYFTL